MNDATTSETRRDRWVFYPVAVAGVLFCITVFAVMASSIGDPDVPLKKWLNRHASVILTIETSGLLGLGLLAMTLDRLLTLRSRAALRADTPLTDAEDR